MSHSMSHSEAKRKPNWSSSEIEVLTSAFSDKADILEGKLTSRLTFRDKQSAWEDIVELVNSHSMVGRSIEETKKKVSDLKVIAKKKERKRVLHARGTGGGPPAEDLSKWEVKILDTLPKDAIYGLAGGIDTFIKDKSKTDIAGDETIEKVTISEIVDIEDTVSTPTDEFEEKTPCKKRRLSNSPHSSNYMYQQQLLNIEEKKLILMEQRNDIELQKVEEIKKLSNTMDSLLTAVLLK